MPELSTPLAIVGLVLAAGVILVAGPRMVAVAGALAERTGLGEAVVGAFFVGAATSLPDGVATLTPAIAGLPDLAAGNALGGVVGQTAFLAVADLAYRSGHLGRVGASNAALVQGAMLLILLGLVLALVHGPQVALLGVHPGTLGLFLVYGYGVWLVARVSRDPRWRPVDIDDAPDPEIEAEVAEVEPLKRLWVRFAALTVVLGLAGWILIPAAESIVATTGMSRTAAGTFITGVASSLAELVVSISAVKAGALTLAVGNVLGGNMFDTTLVGAADVAYREGPIYAAFTPDHSLVASIGVVVTAITLLGLLRRERAIVARAGSESILVLAAYVATVVLVAT